MAPGLMSLPPELLEIIGDCLETNDNFRNFRSTCKTVESATRRTFAKVFFSIRNIVLPGNVPIDHTFGPALPQDLAAATWHLHFYCKHDVLHANDFSGSEDVFKSRAMYHAEAMMNATRLTTYLAQFPNVRFVWIGEDSQADKPYQGVAHPANDGCIWHEWTITKDFTTIMAALRACDVRLKKVFVRPWDRSGVNIGIHNLGVLVRMAPQLAELRDLALEFADTGYTEHTGPSLSVVISSQLAELAPMVPRLQELTLQGRSTHDFNPVQGFATSSPTFQNLTTLCLIACDCGARDLGAFLSAHAKTLQSFCTFRMSFQGSWGDVATMLRTVAMELHALKTLMMSYPCVRRMRLRFPGVNNVWTMDCKDADDDDDWVMVCSRDGVQLQDRDEVAHGTRLMLSNFEY